MPGSARERLLKRARTADDEMEMVRPIILEELDVIEAEAVAAERARLRALVEGLEDIYDHSVGQWPSDDGELENEIDRRAVLALLGPRESAGGMEP